MPRCFLLLALVCAAELQAGEHWPGWRGPGGMGICDEMGLPIKWDVKGANVLWKAPLLPAGKVRPDQNQSSPIVWGEKVFVTVSYWPEGVSEKEYAEHHVLCFRTADGERLWDTVVPPGPWKLSDIRGGYTAPTPAADAERVYVLFGSAVLAALDHQGKIVWRKEITPHHFDVAIGVSPIVYRDTVIVVCDQLRESKASCIKAFDGKTGELRWEQKRPSVDWAHSTPVIAPILGAPQLLVATANGPQGLDPANGNVLWSFNYPERIGDTVSPVTRNGILYVDSGRSGTGVAVSVVGMGDVSKTNLKWTLKSVPEGFSSPVIVGDYLFRLHGPGVLTCLKWPSGEPVYKERLEGSNQAVSPFITLDNRLYVASSGKSFVIRPGPTLEVLAVNDLGDPSQASPAVAAGRIYLKGRRHLYCIGAKSSAPVQPK